MGVVKCQLEINQLEMTITLIQFEIVKTRSLECVGRVAGECGVGDSVAPSRPFVAHLSSRSQNKRPAGRVELHNRRASFYSTELCVCVCAGIGHRV